MTIVNHDYPLSNELLIVDEQNEPIEGAVIRIFDLTNFQADVVDVWEAETISDIDGKWVDPIALEDGRSWVVHVQKLTEFGPNHVEITT